MMSRRGPSYLAQQQTHDSEDRPMIHERWYEECADYYSEITVLQRGVQI